MRSPHRQRGVALIIALILVALATILATKLTFDGFLERRRTMGVLAAEQLLDQIAGSGHLDVQQIVVAPELIVRESTAKRHGS